MDIFYHDIKQWVNDLWMTKGKEFNYPHAREEILAHAKLYFYEKGSTIPKYVYTEEDCDIPYPHPLFADSYGIFPEIFKDSEDMDGYSFRLAKRDDTALIQGDADRLFNQGDKG